MDRKLLSTVIIVAVITSLSSVVLGRVLEASPATAATPNAQAAAGATRQSIAVLKRIIVNDNAKLNDIQAKIDGIMFRRLKAVDDRTTAMSQQLASVATILDRVGTAVGIYSIRDSLNLFGLVAFTESCVRRYHPPCTPPSP